MQPLKASRPVDKTPNIKRLRHSTLQPIILSIQLKIQPLKEFSVVNSSSTYKNFTFFV
jgi:hypothetical protein